MKRDVLLICIFFLVCSFYSVDAGIAGGNVFVTDILDNNGNLGGLAGAHEICRIEAGNTNEDSGDWWKAWVSTADAEAKDFIARSYERACSDGEGGINVIANNWEKLISGYLYSPINCLADGNLLGGHNTVYTGTTIDGSFAGHNCDDFTSGSEYDFTRFGSTSLGDNNGWTNVFGNSIECDISGRLYCFTQTFDGDADEIDCENPPEGQDRGTWLNFGSGCGLDGGCDTFHDYETSFCCGDDDYEYHIFGDIHGCCEEGVHTHVVDGVCMTEEEYEYSVSLSVVNGNLCDSESQSFNVIFTNNGDIGVDGVSITDEIYDSNNEPIHTENHDCGNVVGEGSCSLSYSYDLNEGSYYHNVVGTYDGGSVEHNNYRSFEVYDNLYLAHGCCINEGQSVVEGKLCCKDVGGGVIEEIPPDGDGNTCGCPTPLEWIDEQCRYPRAPCYPVFEQCEYTPQGNFALWLASPGCFLLSQDEEYYEYACCSYQPEGDYPEIWDFDLPDSMIEVY